MGRRRGRWFLGGPSENFPAKRGAIPKIEGEGDHAGICTGLRGLSKENWRGGGVMQNFSEIIKKTTTSLPIKK